MQLEYDAEYSDGGEENKRICHEVGWVCPITSLHLQHVTNLYIAMFFIRYHSKIGLWNVLRDFPIAMEIPSKHQVRFNDFNSVTSYLWLNWMCRVLIGQSYLIAWVWILAIANFAIAIGPLLIRPITKIIYVIGFPAEVYFESYALEKHYHNWDRPREKHYSCLQNIFQC